MYGLSILYLVSYCIIFFSLILIFNSLNFDNCFIQFSLQRLFSGISMYSVNNYLIFILVMLFSGLPPTFIFFLKINIIVIVINNSSYMLLLLIILNSLINVFFYIFFFKQSLVLDNDCLVFFSKNNIFSFYVNTFYNKYLSYYFAIVVMFFSFFGFFLFIDFYLIVNFFFE
jgi:NADH:ubiquinone oxidoreductase subunit 2 (subunit N)